MQWSKRGKETELVKYGVFIRYVDSKISPEYSHKDLRSK
jgi:hypothetical protein